MIYRCPWNKNLQTTLGPLSPSHVILQKYSVLNTSLFSIFTSIPLYELYIFLLLFEIRRCNIIDQMIKVDDRYNKLRARVVCFGFVERNRHIYFIRVLYYFGRMRCFKLLSVEWPFAYRSFPNSKRDDDKTRAISEIYA